MKDPCRKANGESKARFLPSCVPSSSCMHKEGSEGGAALLPCLQFLHQGLLFSLSSVVLVVRGLGDAQGRDRAAGRNSSDPWLWKEVGKRK